MHFWYYVSRPFFNLTNKERTIQILRLTTHGLTLILALAALIAPLITDALYIGRINCAHLDVSYGLYKSLRNSVSATPNADILSDGDEADGGSPVDTALTNSEISILTEYATAQVANAPQFILTSIWSWCYGNYNITHYTDKHGNQLSYIQDKTVKCSKTDNNFVFDYRKELEDVGLDSILAYAYHSSEDGAKYKHVVSERDKKYRLVPPAIMFCGASQLLLVIFTIMIYSNRGDAKDLSKMPTPVLHVAGLVAAASFIAATIAAGIITSLLIEIRSEIHNSLGSFGVSFHVGEAWLSLIWASQAISIFAALSWAGPLWCANPDIEEEDEYEFSHPNRKSYLHNRRRTTGEVSQYRDRTPFADQEVEDVSDEEVSATDNAVEGTSNSRLNKMKRSFSTKRKRLSGLKLGGHRTSEDQEFVNLMEENNSDEDDREKTRHSFGKGIFHTHHTTYVDKNEEELRKLGETLSKKSSVRRINTRGSRGSKVKVEPLIIEEKEAMDILYQDKEKDHLYPNVLHHYREETYDGYNNGSRPKTVPQIEVESETVPYSNSSRTLAPRPNQVREVEGENPYSETMAPNTAEPRPAANKKLPSGYPGDRASTSLYSFDESFLATEEIDFLDTNNFMNKL